MTLIEKRVAQVLFGAFFVLGFLAAWEASSRFALPRIPQPDDSTFAISEAPAPIGSHVDGCVRFKVGDREILRLDPDGLIYVRQTAVGRDSEVLDGFRAFLEGAEVTDSRGRTERVGEAESYHDYTFQSGRAAAKGDGGDVILVNQSGTNYAKEFTTTFFLPLESPLSLVREALLRPAPKGYRFGHVERVSDGTCTIFWKKDPK